MHRLWDEELKFGNQGVLLEAWFNGYLPANQIFARATATEVKKLQGKSIILLQDYHLFMAALYLKELTSNCVITHFTHIPWPPPEHFKILPPIIRYSLLRGLLSNDLLGFQSAVNGKNFMLCCQELPEVEVDFHSKTIFFRSQKTVVKTYPISVSYKSLLRAAQDRKVEVYERKIKRLNRGLKLIVRTDRSDPSKNIIRGFLAYEKMLYQHPELRGKVTFLAFLYPSRERIAEYKRYRLKIEQTVLRINQKLGSKGWQPIKLRIKDNYEESLAALKCYDVLLVNSLFDGMNLVAKEGPLINKTQGVLILSQNTGAHEQLKNECLSINPFDIEGTARALYQALTMPKTQKEKQAHKLREIIRQDDAVSWLFNQLNDIEALEREKAVALYR
jgi:trehalose 6-phosphate synthase